MLISNFWWGVSLKKIGNIDLKNNFLFSLNLSIICLGVVFDLLKVHYFSFPDSYFSTIYNTIISLSILGVSLLTLIIHLFDREFFGFQLKAILRNRKSYVSINRLIPLSLFLTLLAYLFLTIQFYNSLVCTFFSTIGILFCFSDLIMKSLTKDDYLIKLLDDMLESKISNGTIEYMYIRKILEYIEKNKEYSNLHKVNPIISKYIKILNIQEKEAFSKDSVELLNKVALEKGILYIFEYLKDFLILIETHSNRNTKYDLIEAYLNQIEIRNVIEIVKNNYIQVLDQINKLPFLSQYQINMINYQCFKVMYSNEIISSEFRFRQLDLIVTAIFKNTFSIIENSNKVDFQVLFMLIKNFILLNEDYDASKKILKIFVREIGKLYIRDSNYYTFLAIIYFMSFVFSELEVGTLRIQHREKIKQLLDSDDSEINLTHSSIKGIFKDHFQGICEKLWDLVFEIEEYSYLDYFPTHMEVKQNTWSIFTFSEFAFANLFFSENYYEFSFESKFEKYTNDATYTMQIKALLSNLLSNIENNKKISQSMEIYINSIKSFIELPIIDIDQTVETLVAKMNEKMKRLSKYKKISESANQLDLKSIRQMLTLRYSKESHLYEKDLTESNSEIIKLKINPSIEKTEYLVNSEMKIFQLELMINILINKYLKSTINVIDIPYSIEGIRKMKSFMNVNLTYYSNFDFKRLFQRFVKEYPEFSTIQNIKTIKTFPFNMNLLMVEDSFGFKIYLNNIRQRPLNNDEAFDFVKKFKVDEQNYRIDGVFYDKNQAVEKILNEYKYEEVDIDLFVKIDTNNIKLVKFVYR